MTASPYSRLRQVCLATEELSFATATMEALFGIAPCFEDKEVAQFGLSNTLFALDGTYLEFVSPVRADASVTRFLARGPDRGAYMVAVDCSSLCAARERVLDLGARIIFETTRECGSGFQIHPADAANVILELDSHAGGQDIYGPYAWSESPSLFGVRERAHASLLGIGHVSTDAQAPAQLWAKLLARPFSSFGTSAKLELDNGFIEFRRSAEPAQLGVQCVHIAADRPTEVVASAKAIGLPESEHGFMFCGVRMKIHAR